MFRLRPLLIGTMRTRNILHHKVKVPVWKQIRFHGDEPTEPFDNMPFNVTNRYTLTLFFSIFFGIGLWAPFIIVWYSMAKRTF